jgi:hypothetical protein
VLVYQLSIYILHREDFQFGVCHLITYRQLSSAQIRYLLPETSLALYHFSWSEEQEVITGQRNITINVTPKYVAPFHSDITFKHILKPVSKLATADRLVTPVVSHICLFFYEDPHALRSIECGSTQNM